MKKESGFSLAEMMVLLLVLAITAAASAPLITTKLHGVAGNNPPWQYSDTDGSIAYNTKGGNIAAVIGTTHAPKFKGKKARLHIDAKDKSMSHILMQEGDDLVDFRASNDSVVLSNGSYDHAFSEEYDNNTLLEQIKKSLILGPNIVFSVNGNTNNVVVGKYFTDYKTDTQYSTVLTAGMFDIPIAKQTNKNSLCIANRADYFGDNSVVIGLNPVNGSYGESSNGTVLIGSSPGYNGGKVLIAGPIVRHNKSIWLGEYANASGNNTIAIGYHPYATVDYGIAIGKYAQVQGEKSIAIGEAKLYKTETINGKETTTIANNTVAISELDRKIKASNTVALGGDANDNSVVIGYTSRADSTDCIQIGHSTSIGGASPYSIAIGRGAKVDYYEDLSTGDNNDKTYFERWGVDWFVKDKNHYYWGGKNVVIGNNSKANSNRSTVIGANVELKGGGDDGQLPRQIVLGTADSTVYIPGKLVVRGDTYLAYGNEEQTETPYVFMGVAQKNKTNWTHRRVIKEDTGTEEYRTLRVHKDTGREFDVGSDPLSDRRLKNVGEVFKAGLEEIKKLEVFHYTFKKDLNQTPRVGVMAQDLQKIFPDAVFKGEDGFLRIRMEDMFYALVNAIKELDRMLTVQKDNMDVLAKNNKVSYKRLAKIEKRIAKLEKKEIKASKKRLKNEDK